MLVEELVRLGITRFYASPGSRSTPLVVAAASNPRAELSMHVDERGSAFMALGYARATARAAVWITTSGTALANGMPAVVEASMEAVPLLLLTADRPPELRDTDSNQTIRQDHIFGSYVRWFHDMSPPSADVDPCVHLTAIDHAVSMAHDGPVHVNCMFREPLAPDSEEFVINETAALSRWHHGAEPFTRTVRAMQESDGLVQSLEKRISQADRPLIVLGRLRGDAGAAADAAQRLCLAHNAVFYADIGSQSRLGLEHSRALPFLDGMLYGAALDEAEMEPPDLVIQFGASPVSKRLNAWVAKAPLMIVDHRPRRVDPHHRSDTRLVADADRLLVAWANRVDESRSQSEWVAAWTLLSARASAWHEAMLDSGFTEQNMVRSFMDHLDGSEALTVASSASVRYADGFSGVSTSRVPICINRGASGIDGTLATAAGFADGTRRRPYVLIGDLAFLHDLNSLGLMAERKGVVLVLNNDGGGIFSWLPIRRHEAVFEPWFGTPHGMRFAYAAAQFGLQYQQPDSMDALEKALESARTSEDGVLIEVNTDREGAWQEQRRLLQSLKSSLTDSGEST